MRAYAAILLVAYAIAIAAMLLDARGGLGPFGKPIGGDFIIFYAASALALKGHALAAWSAAAILAAERQVVPGSRGLLLWCYPPAFLALIAPLARLPYGWALAAWTGTTGGLYLAMTRLISQDRWAIPAALAFPGAFVTAIQGQNGFLSAAVLGTGLLLVERRPWLGGAVLGLIVYKPQFGLLLPILLLGSGRWRGALATGVSAGALILVSAALFGVDSWRAFFEHGPEVSRALASGALPLAKVPTVFAAARLCGLGVATAYALQAAVGAGAAWTALVAWRRPGPWPLKAGLAITATLLATPYAFDYDLVILAAPIGVLAVRAGSGATGLRGVLAMAAVAPLVAPVVAPWLADRLHLPAAPLILGALHLVTLRQLAAEHAPDEAALPIVADTGFSASMA